MKIPLIVQADPTKCISPVVFLYEGQWTIVSDHKHTELFIVTQDGPLPYIERMKILGNQRISLEFRNPKSEKITVEAHKCL